MPEVPSTLSSVILSQLGTGASSFASGLVHPETILKAYSVVGLGIFALWCTPYNFIVKQKILQILIRYSSKGKGVRLLIVMGVFSFIIAYKKKLQLQQIKNRIKQRADGDEEEEEEEEGEEEEKEKGKQKGWVTKRELKEVIEGMKGWYWGCLGVLTSFFIFRANYLAEGSLQDLISLENKKIESEMVKFQPPPMTILKAITSPFTAFLSPVFLDVHKIPTGRPLMFVSNHTIMGLDFPLLLTKLWGEEKIFLRALADHSHFQVPINAMIMRDVLGAVDGTRRNVDLLMEKQACIFVYPGGARETFKRTTDKKYEIIWGNRTGFAEMALRYGCTIVPVTNYGTEDMVEVIGDLPLGWVPIPFLWNSDRTLPLMRVTADVSSFSKGRVYFKFGDPIPTHHLLGREEEDDAIQQVVKATKQAIEQDIGYLKEYSEVREKEYEEKRRREGGGGGWRGRVGSLGRMLRMRAKRETGELTAADLEELGGEEGEMGGRASL